MMERVIFTVWEVGLNDKFGRAFIEWELGFDDIVRRAYIYKVKFRNSPNDLDASK